VPRDSLDLPSRREGAYRSIPWDLPTPPLDEGRRAKLVHAWSWRREQEHLAVGGFCELARMAARLGCDPMILALLTRAATEEVHHADVCRRVVEKHTGEPQPTILIGAAADHLEQAAEPEQSLLFTIVGTCCISETMTGAYFAEMLELATHPVARAVVLSLLEDEINHGKVGWAYLAAAKRDGRTGGLSTVLPDLVRRHVKEVIDDGREAPEEDDPELDQHGYMGRTRAARIYQRTLREVVFPGFDALEIDAREAKALAAEAGWI
jgi:hypothetical protein